MDLVFTEFDEISLETLVIDGREAAVLEYAAIINGVEAQSLFLTTIFGDTIWTNGFLVRKELADFSEYETDFQNIVRSLKIHR